MAFLTFRGSSTTPSTPGSTTANAAPLTNAQIDGNFASLNNSKLETTGGAISGDLTISGNLTVNGLTTTINSSAIVVDDKNIDLGAVSSIAGVTATLATGTAIVTVASTSGMIPGQALTKTAGAGAFGATPVILSVDSATQFTASVNHATAGAITFTVGGATDTTANGGGITVIGATNKTLNWNSTTSAWTSSEHVDLASGKSYYIGQTAVLSASGVLSSAASVSLGGSSTTVLTLGSSASATTLTVGGTGNVINKITINAGATGTPTLDSGNAGAAAKLFPAITTGSITLGENITSGSVSIANGTALATGAAVNIMSGALATASTRTVNIGANGSTTSTTTINIGTGATNSTAANVNIGTAAKTITQILGTLKFGTSNTANYILGSSGTTDGTVSWVALPAGQTAGSTTAGYLQYNGTTKAAGRLDGGTTAPSSTTRLNYDGYLYATRFYGDGSQLTGIISGATLSTVAASTTYYIGLAPNTTGAWVDGRVDTSNLYYTSGNQTLYCTNYNTSSDIRLKDNVVTIDSALSTINTLRGVEFTWKENGQKTYGVIAQEIEQVLPELVSEVDNKKSVNYNALIGFLIQAVKELSDKVEKLENVV